MRNTISNWFNVLKQEEKLTYAWYDLVFKLRLILRDVRRCLDQRFFKISRLLNVSWQCWNSSSTRRSKLQTNSCKLFEQVRLSTRCIHMLLSKLDLVASSNLSEDWEATYLDFIWTFRLILMCWISSRRISNMLSMSWVSSFSSLSLSWKEFLRLLKIFVSNN